MTNRNMTRAELDTVLDWAAAEGWNPGLTDADAFFAADPDGFFVAEEAGQIVAAISVVNHTTDFAFLGLYLCLPASRGRGVGYRLWQHALRHAGNRTVGLDGVPDQQDNYRKSGFELAGQTLRHVGRFPEAMAPQVRAMNLADLPALEALDLKVQGYARSAFLRPWLTGTDSRKTLVWDDGTGPQACITWRACRDGAKIGPLMAPDMARAKDVLAAVAAAVPDGPLIIDVDRAQTELSDWCAGHDMDVPFKTARMYKGPAPTGMPVISSVATLELG